MTTSQPPGPTIPSVVQLFRMVQDPYAFLRSCHKEFGDFFTLRFPGQPPFVHISDPEAIRWVFTRPREELTHANELATLVLGDRSVLMMDGEPHRRERQMLMPPFHGNRMRTYGGTMRDATREAIARWPRGRPFVAHPELQRITLRVVTTSVFGAARGPETLRLERHLEEFLDASLTPALYVVAMFLTAPRLRSLLLRQGATDPTKALHWVRRRLFPWQAFADHRAELDRILLAEIRRCREANDGDRQDILAMLAQASDERGEPMTDAEIRDELLTLLIAGHETTATTLNWALYHIARTRGVEARIRAELAEVFAGGTIDPKGVERLAYLKAVVNETLRISPIAVAVVRRLNAPMQLGAHDLAAGTVIAPCIYLAHHHPKLWEAPSEFRPERFLQKEPSPFTFFPFGGGTRRCVGIEFARYQLRTVLAQIFSSVSVSLPEGFSMRPMMRGVTVAPPTSMRFVIRDAPIATGPHYETQWAN
jgi:cytochrome P450